MATKDIYVKVQNQIFLKIIILKRKVIYVNIVISTEEEIIEECPIENPFIPSQCTDFNEILQYSSNDSNNSNIEEVDLAENIVDNNYETINITINRNKTFASELQFGAISNNISNNALSKLLTLYKKYHPNENIPSDARVFLHTPKECVSVTQCKPCGNEEFLYFGLQKVLLKYCRQNTLHLINNFIIIDINIDGLPISKSTNKQLWPIQGKIINVDQPFIIGIYYGMSKPSSVEEFLNEFDECCILRDQSFEWNGNHYFVKIRAVICDSPARSFIKWIKYCTGYKMDVNVV